MFGKNLERVLTGTVLLYFLFALFSISLTQIAGFAGLVTLLAWFQWNQAWKSIELPLIRFFALFTLSAILAIVFAESFFVSLNYSKHLLEPLLFYWLLNSISRINLGAFVPWKLLIKYPQLKEKVQGITDRLPSDHGLQVCMHLLVIAGTAVAIIGFFESMSSGWWATPISTLNNAMTLSIVLMMLDLVAVARVFSSSPGRGRNLYMVMVALMTLTLLMGARREAWLGFLVGAVCLIWNFKRKWLMVLPLALVLVYFVSPQRLQERMNLDYALNDASILYRFKLWNAGLQVIGDHPVLGCGFGCLKVIYDDYPDHLELFRKIKFVHNTFIQLTVDTGLLGLTSWLMIWVAYIHLLKKWKRRFGQDSLFVWAEQSALCVLVSFMVASFFETHFYDQETMMIFYPILAFPFAMREKK